MIRVIDRRKIKRILIIRWGGMGDLVIASAVIEDIASAFPECRIDLSTEKPWDSLFRNDYRFNEILTCQVRGNHRIRNAMKWLREISMRKYDLIIDLQSNDHSAILMALLAIFYKKPLYIAGNRLAFPYNIRSANINSGDHALAHFQAPLIGLEITVKTRNPVIHVTKQENNHVNKLIKSNGLEHKSYIIFAPGSSYNGIYKRWGTENYCALASELIKTNKKKIVLVGASLDAEVCEAIAISNPDNIINLCGKTTVCELVPLAKSACFIVGNDTGAIHVAAASGTPCLVLFGGSDSRLSRPIGDNVHYIQADLEKLKQGLKPERNSIKNISINDVLNKLVSI